MSVVPPSKYGSSRNRRRVARYLSMVLITFVLSVALRQIPVQAAFPPVAYDDVLVTNEDTPNAITLNASDQDGDTLYFAIVNYPGHGALGGTLPDMIYAPHADYNGSDSFTFRVNDGDRYSNVATISISVTAVNDPPVADAQAVSTNEDTALPIVLTGSDIDGDSLSFTILSQPANGSLTGSAPNVTYTPNTNYNGSDSFTFKVNDGTTDSNTATVSITVYPVEDAPIADAQNILTARNTAKAITLTGSDVDGDTLTFSVLSRPTNGVLTGTPPNLTYTPHPNFSGSDNFTFKVNDGALDSNPATVSITVNAPPVAGDQSVSTFEDTSLPIVLTATDDEGDTLTYTILDGPTNGVLSGTAPNVTYTPHSNYNGPDSFTFKVNDGYQDSGIATVSIAVTPVNDPPVANDQSVTTDEDASKAIILTATDPDGDALTFLLVTGPANGVLTGTAPNVTYTPNANFNGPDSFSFQVNDGTTDSNIATVSITVNPVNDPPVANDQSVTTDEDTAKPIVLAASDVEGSPLHFSIVAQPTHGVLTGTAPNVTYTPNANFNGPDSFSFKANDGALDSNVATVSITVNAVEDLPVAYDKSIQTNEDSPQTFSLDASDADGDPLVYTIVVLPQNGAISGVLPNVTYTPRANYNGPDSFTFKANDGDQDSNVATVSITVKPVNDPPIAIDQGVTTDEDASKAIILAATDVDGDPLTYEIKTPPTHGTLSGTAPNLTYTPFPNYNGTDMVGFVAKDQVSSSNVAWVTIEIAPVNDPPTANSMTVIASEDSAEGITLTGTDLDGDPLTFSITVQPLNGSLTGTPPHVTYSPKRDYYGPDSFTFQVRDPAGRTGTAQVKLTVTNVNDDPRATDDSATIEEDSTEVAINVIYNDTYLPDPFETLTIASTTPPSHGQITIPQGGGHVAYTPNRNYYGADSFTYTIGDGHGGSATGTVAITVTNTNDPPVAQTDSAAMDEDSGSLEINVVANDTYLPDPEEELTIVGIGAAPNGTVTLVAGSTKRLIYTPDPNYFGTDTFTYNITDNNGGYSTGLVRVTVRPINDPPIAEDDHASTAEDQIVTIDVLANDTDIDSELDRSSVKVKTRPGHGTTSVNHTTGAIIYDPEPNWHGVDSLTYQVCDDAKPALCDQAQLDIAVGSVNDPPVSKAGPDQEVNTNTRVTLDGSASYDPDGNLPLQYIWSRISGPAVVLTNPNAESPSFIAPDDPCVLVFALTVIDAENRADVTPDQVAITVNNQPPVSDAGPDKIVQVDSEVSLDGTGSTDPDGDLPLEYLWTQSGGPSVILSDPTSPTPTFTTPSAASILTFTLFVTDTFGDPDATPDQVVITVSEPFYVYLPSVLGRYVVAPNLVVESLTANRRNVELVIRNLGNAPVTGAFWVDVYINPDRPPAAVNETFDDLGTYGLAWAVVNEGLRQLVPGGSLTLRMNDVYYDPDISIFPDSLQPGTPIYAQVDSFNPGTTYGTVRESHELIQEPYDNILGPVLSQDAAAASGEVPPPSAKTHPAPQDVPKRP